MKTDTLLQTCLYITLSLIGVMLFINFVGAMGVFSQTETGTPIGEATDIWGLATEITGIDTIFGIAIGAGLGLGIGLSFLTHSIAPVGISLYSSIFWSAYSKTLSLFDVGNYMNDFGMAGVVVIVTAILLMVWAGSVIGVLTGSA